MDAPEGNLPPRHVMSLSQDGQPRGSPVANASNPAAKDLSSRQQGMESRGKNVFSESFKRQQAQRNQAAKPTQRSQPAEKAQPVPRS